jgi:hypothetical protein
LWEEHVASIFRIERVNQARNQREAGSKQSYLLHAGFLLGLFFDLEHEGDMLLRNVS